MLDLVDAAVVDSRRCGHLPLGISLLDGLTDQAVPLGIKGFCAADFVSYPSEAGQRVLACHTISSAIRCALLVAIAHPGYHRKDALGNRIAGTSRHARYCLDGRVAAAYGEPASLDGGGAILFEVKPIRIWGI
jgi:hypothetical protein